MLVLSYLTDEAVEKWLANYPSDYQRYKYYFLKDFLDYLQNDPQLREKAPSQLVEFQRNVDGDGQFVILRALQQFVRDREGTAKSLKLRYATVRGFFAKNHAELPHDLAFKVRATRDSVKGKLSVDVVRTLIDNADLVGKAIYLSLWQGLLDLERFCILNFERSDALVKHLKEQGVETPFMFEFPGRKRSSERFYTLLGRDALQAWKTLFERYGWPEPGRPLIEGSTTHRRLKASILQKHLRLLESLNYIKRGGGSSANRTGMNPHETRDVARMYLQVKAKQDGLDMNCIRFLMGHVSEQNEYDRFYTDKEYVLSNYRIAEKYLNVLSHVEHVEIQRVVDKRIDDLLMPVVNELFMWNVPSFRALPGVRRSTSDEENSWMTRWTTRLEELKGLPLEAKLNAIKQLKNEIVELCRQTPEIAETNDQISRKHRRKNQPRSRIQRS